MLLLFGIVLMGMSALSVSVAQDESEPDDADSSTPRILEMLALVPNNPAFTQEDFIGFSDFRVQAATRSGAQDYDSWAEFEWLDRFYTYIRRTGGTAIIITHRFSTAMRADLIYVMDAGEVVEQGTHEELIAASGRYATSWKVQMAAGAAADDLVPAPPESA